MRVSASRVKTLNQCSLAFYYDSVLRIPSPLHIKTKIGSLTHSILQHLFHPKRRLAVREMLANGFHLYQWPSIARYVQSYTRHHQISPYQLEDIESMLQVAFVGLRRHFFVDGGWSPPPTIHVEKRFQYHIGEAEVSGVFDLLLVWPERAVCIDYKTTAAKFVKAEVPHLIQGRLYQHAANREFGLIPTVEFLMLRFPPTDRTPDKHIQRVEPASPTMLRGLETYIVETHSQFNRFTLEDAYANVCEDDSFCSYRCSYLRPFTYWVLCRADDPKGLNPISSHLSLDTASKLSYSTPNTILLERTYKGCAIKWKQ